MTTQCECCGESYSSSEFFTCGCGHQQSVGEEPPVWEGGKSDTCDVCWRRALDVLRTCSLSPTLKHICAPLDLQCIHCQVQLEAIDGLWSAR